MKKILLIATLVLLAAVSCSREEVRKDGGNGTVTLRLNTGAASRATVPGDGVVADGGGIFISGAGVPDLVILLVDGNGDVAMTYPGTGSSLQADPQSTEMSVTFTGLSGVDDGEDDFTAYAFANTEGLWDMQSSGSAVSDLTALTRVEQIEALQFVPLAADTAPALKNGRLPLSAVKSFQVSSLGNGEVSLEMLRCIAKVTMEFVNNTDDTLTLADFSFALRNICPDRGFVTPHALPELPDNIAYGDVEVDEGTKGFSIGASKDTTFFVFPGVAVANSREYTMDVDFKPNGALTGNSYRNLPVHNNKAENLLQIERNQHIHIVTRISRGLTVSFNFEVMPWELMEERILFD